jgi:hypothetical protein
LRIALRIDGAACGIDDRKRLVFFGRGQGKINVDSLSAAVATDEIAVRVGARESFPEPEGITRFFDDFVSGSGTLQGRSVNHDAVGKDKHVPPYDARTDPPGRELFQCLHEIEEPRFVHSGWLAELEILVTFIVLLVVDNPIEMVRSAVIRTHQAVATTCFDDRFSYLPELFGGRRSSWPIVRDTLGIIIDNRRD